jgi:polar amino acid transport system substrate-binding protein
MRANDERFRLIVDRTLARLHASGEFVRLYTKWFGEPDESTLQFFRWNTLSE